MTTEIKNSVPEILETAAATFRERNAVYGSNYQMVAPIMNILFPNGIPNDVAFSDQFHLFELIVVKLSRFAISGLTHQDSIHDACVYSAMIEAIVIEQGRIQAVESRGAVGIEEIPYGSFRDELKQK